MLRISHRLAAASCILLTAFTTTACSHRTRPAPAAPTVATSIAQLGVIQPSVQLAGIVAPYENVAIQTTLTEPTDAVNVQEGDRVTQGEVLAQLDTADLQAMLAADVAAANGNQANTSHTIYQGSLTISQGVNTVRAAQAALTRDQDDLNRYQALYGNGYVSQQQVADQAATVRNDAATLASAQQAVQANGTLNSAGLQQSSVQQSKAQEQQALAQAQQERVQIAKATITSPINGVVVNRNLNPGEYPGTRQIFTLQQIDPIYAVLHGSGAQIANIQTGTRAIISSGDIGTAQYVGSVIGVLNQIAPGSTDFQVKILLQNPEQKLRPGMAVQGTIALPTIRGVRIPETAFTDDNHNAVLTVADDGTVKTVPVSERANDGTISIVSGITSGTRIVSDGQSSVGDGEKIVYQGESPAEENATPAPASSGAPHGRHASQ